MREHIVVREHILVKEHILLREHVLLRELRTHSSKEDMREVFIYGTFAQGGWVGRRAREGRGLSQVSLQLVVREEGREREGEGVGGGKGRRGREKEGKREKAGERERERERGREKRWNVPWVKVIGFSYPGSDNDVLSCDAATKKTKQKVIVKIKIKIK